MGAQDSIPTTTKKKTKNVFKLYARTKSRVKVKGSSYKYSFPYSFPDTFLLQTVVTVRN